MATDEVGSISRLIVDLKAGDPVAAQPLWERYFERMVRLARRRLAGRPAARGVEDEEDAALSAFESFCEGAVRGQYPRLADRDDLWRLLVVITARKASALVQRHRALKRGGGLGLATGAAGPDASPEIDDVIGREPTPEFALMVAEEYTRLLDRLGNDDLRRVAQWRLEGYSNDEIAERLGCARRTVARRLELIRLAWQAEVAG
jgi:DNA-directed RNA polymerase specialized sigma24 family protein